MKAPDNSNVEVYTGQALLFVFALTVISVIVVFIVAWWKGR